MSLRKLTSNFENPTTGWPIERREVKPIDSGSPLFPSAPVISGYCDALIASSSNHRLKNGAWSGGGPLYVRKVKVSHTNFRHVPFRPFGVDLGTYSIGGVSGVDWSIPESILATAPSFSDATSGMAALAVKGYKRTRPGQPQASLGQFLVELRQLPQLPFQRKWLFKTLKYKRFRDIPVAALRAVLDFKALGSEYLNYQFGWKPFISDLRKIYNIYTIIDAQMARIIRENATTLHRKATLNESNDVTQSEVNVSYPYYNVSGAPPNFGFSGFSRYTVTTRTKVKEWISNAYRYYIFDLGSSQWTRRAKLALFGALPTPDLIYQITPWSWLIDWFSNVGDVMSNYSANAAENLAMLYSYTMRHTEVTEQAQCDSYHTAHPAGWWPEVDAGFLTTRKTEIKLRIPSGSPFQFGADLQPLTGYQASILAALGASRGLVR